MQRVRLEEDPRHEQLTKLISSLAILSIVFLTVLKSFEAVSIEAQLSRTGQAVIKTQNQLSLSSAASKEAALGSQPIKAAMVETPNYDGSAYKILKEQWERTSRLAATNSHYKDQFVQAQQKMIDLLLNQSSYLQAVKCSEDLLKAEMAQKPQQLAAIAQDHNNLAVATHLEALTIPTASPEQRKSRVQYLNSAIENYEEASKIYALTGKHQSAQLLAKLNEYQALKDLGENEKAHKVFKEARQLNLTVGYRLSPPMYFD